MHSHLTISLDVSEESPVDGLDLTEECPLVNLHQVLEWEHVRTIPEVWVGLQLGRVDGGSHNRREKDSQAQSTVEPLYKGHSE